MIISILILVVNLVKFLLLRKSKRNFAYTASSFHFSSRRLTHTETCLSVTIFVTIFVLFDVSLCEMQYQCVFWGLLQALKLKKIFKKDCPIRPFNTLGAFHEKDFFAEFDIHFTKFPSIPLSRKIQNWRNSEISNLFRKT